MFPDNEKEESLEVKILRKYLKVDNRNRRMKMISKVREEFLDNPKEFHKCFAENTKLEKVTLGNGCGELPKNVFSGCSLLSSVVLSNGLSTISDAAFANCKVLESISIPGTVLQIGQNRLYKLE